MKKRIYALLLMLVLLASLLAGCAGQNNAEVEYKRIQDLAESKIGLITGAMTALLVPEILPDADYQEYNSIADVAMALDAGKIASFPVDESAYLAMLWENRAFARVEEALASSDYGVIFAKGENPELQEQFNTFLKDFKESGQHQAYEEKWFGSQEPTEFLDYSQLDGTNGTLKVGLNSAQKPFVYLKNGKYAGFDVEMLILFAQEYGYRMEFFDTQFGSILTGVALGTYDLGISGFTITEERAQSVDFSDVYHVEDLVMVIQSKDAATADSKNHIFASLASSFEKTFIREARWKLILEGIATTLTISVCSFVCGTLLGFALYLAARVDHPVAAKIVKAFAKVYSRLIAGTPTLVVLMILFYVIFSDLNGVLVAIIGFALIFASFVYGQVTLTVDGVDHGQAEAAYALGYSRNQTFFHIILPQAMKLFIPVYGAEIVSLIKSTSVVGYIAVNDLTKMGDIIRSNTYEALFPLVSVAIIYFLIVWVATSLVEFAIIKIDPKKRKKTKILKGVVR